jgi:glycosyltransferase involved in cell wall biosynthesis
MLSFCTIVKNESVHLARCLESVKPYVDEIVIVDTGSTDDTVAIAQQYGAKIGTFEWCNDFAAARNHALSMVTGDWVLVLDADEELVVKDSHFRYCLTPEAPAIYGLNRLDLFEIEDIANGVHPRLYQKLPGIHYVGRYHEQLRTNADIPLTMELLDAIAIKHYGNSDDNLLHKNQTRDIPILEQMRAEEGLDLWRLDCLARKYEKIGQSDKAQECYAEALDRLFPNLLEGSPPENFFWIPTLLDLLGSQALATEDLETAQLICQRALEWCPNFPPLNYLTGELLMQLGFSRGAIAYFQYCLQMGEDGSYYRGDPVPISFMQTFPAYGLGCAYVQMKDRQNAIAAFNQALAFNPNYVPAQEQLALLSTCPQTAKLALEH